MVLIITRTLNYKTTIITFHIFSYFFYFFFGSKTKIKNRQLDYKRKRFSENSIQIGSAFELLYIFIWLYEFFFRNFKCRLHFPEGENVICYTNIPQQWYISLLACYISSSFYGAEEKI